MHPHLAGAGDSGEGHQQGSRHRRHQVRPVQGAGQGAAAKPAGGRARQVRVQAGGEQDTRLWWRGTADELTELLAVAALSWWRHDAVMLSLRVTLRGVVAADMRLARLTPSAHFAGFCRNAWLCA